jgi:hypothetical protein
MRDVRRHMNRITLVQEAHGARQVWAIRVDGKSLREYFVGGRGVHPSQISPVGWSTADASASRRVVEEFLLQTSGELESKRTPALVCEECGDVACGAFAVRIARRGSVVTWSDWAWENGDGKPRPVDDWAKHPPIFEFSWKEYEEVFSSVLPSA